MTKTSATSSGLKMPNFSKNFEFNADSQKISVEILMMNFEIIGRGEQFWLIPTKKKNDDIRELNYERKETEVRVT